MMDQVRWGVVLFTGLGLSWFGCSGKHDGASTATAGASSGTSGVPGSNAGGGALGGAGNARAGNGPDGAAGAPDDDSAGNAGAVERAGNGGTGTAGSGQSGAGNGGAGNGGADGTCQHVETRFTTIAPTVFVLVDRSSSMFLCPSGSSSTTPGLNCADANDTPWAALRKGMLEVVQELQGSVRFGFGTFTGEIAKTCPTFSAVAPALNNYEAIQSVYETLAAPAFKAETPTAQALGLVQTLLATDAAPGPKYVLLVTDGEPDFCDDGSPVCPVDATVSQLQTMYAAGLGTFIFGVDSPLSNISGASLQAFANAGAGVPVVDPSGLGSAIFYSCQSTAAWNALFTATGKASPAPLASYGPAGSNANVYRPSASDGAALKQAFLGPIAGVKSCTFDLAAGLAVDLSALAGASVTIQGQPVNPSASNGWSMVNSKRLQLNGSACTLWRNPSSQTIAINFPCAAIRTE